MQKKGWAILALAIGMLLAAGGPFPAVTAVQAGRDADTNAAAMPGAVRVAPTTAIPRGAPDAASPAAPRARGRRFPPACRTTRPPSPGGCTG